MPLNVFYVSRAQSSFYHFIVLRVQARRYGYFKLAARQPNVDDPSFLLLWVAGQLPFANDASFRNFWTLKRIQSSFFDIIRLTSFKHDVFPYIYCHAYRHFSHNHPKVWPVYKLCGVFFLHGVGIHLSSKNLRLSAQRWYFMVSTMLSLLTNAIWHLLRDNKLCNLINRPVWSLLLTQWTCWVNSSHWSKFRINL